MITHRVLLDKNKKYLHITTADCWDKDFLIELYNSSVAEEYGTISYNFCITYCQGYIAGNNGVKVLNDVKDFDSEYKIK